MIYIVTYDEGDGCSIQAVFQNKEKAEAYCNCHPHGMIEEWEFFDDNIYTPFDIVFIKMITQPDDNIYFKFETYSKEDDSEFMRNSDHASVYRCSNNIELNLIRMLPKNYDKESIVNKYTEVFYEINPQIKRLFSDLGLSDNALKNDYKKCEYAEQMLKEFIVKKLI